MVEVRGGGPESRAGRDGDVRVAPGEGVLPGPPLCAPGPERVPRSPACPPAARKVKSSLRAEAEGGPGQDLAVVLCAQDADGPASRATSPYSLNPSSLGPALGPLLLQTPASRAASGLSHGHGHPPLPGVDTCNRRSLQGTPWSRRDPSLQLPLRGLRAPTA